MPVPPVVVRDPEVNALPCVIEILETPEIVIVSLMTIVTVMVRLSRRVSVAKTSKTTEG